jgi:hypothetical protein
MMAAMVEFETGTAAPCDCKVGRVAADRRLGTIHEELAGRWGEASVRELAATFNRRVLRAAVESSGRTPLDGEVDNLYRILTDEDVDAGSRTQARERLRQDGAAVETVESQFVSHQTVYRHLSNCLGVSRESGRGDAGSRVDAWRERILPLQTRLSRVTERGIEQLRDGGDASIGSFDVYVDVNVFCEDCGRLYTVEEFLDERVCDCDDDET